MEEGLLEMEKQFDKDYFVDGVKNKKSNYKDYRKRKFVKLANDLIKHIPENAHILDYGCATGGLIREMLKFDFASIRGFDISTYAIEYGKKNLGLGMRISTELYPFITYNYDMVLLLDILEHVPNEENIREILNSLITKEIIVRLPVCAIEGEPYILEVSRNDVTHVQCHTKEWWHELILDCGFQLKTILSENSIYESVGVFARVYKK